MTPGEHPKNDLQRPELRPPGSHPHPDSDEKGKHGLLWVALAVVIALGLAVVLILPKLVSPTDDAAPTAVAPPVQPEPTLPSEQLIASSRIEAEQAMQKLLQTRARLELANIEAWGEPEWSLALEVAAKGDRLFGQRQFSMAAESFLESLRLLQLLESERGQRLANALDSAWQALGIDDSISAMAFFDTALAIEEDNEDALSGSGQARVRPDVIRLMSSGDRARASGDLLEARSAYLEAFTLDAAYKPAAIALNDTNEQINELAFKDAMSQALAALDAEEIETAERALQQAARLKPNEEVVRDTRVQLAQTRQRLWLTSQRQSAATNEHNENWSNAVATYQEVLVRVPQAAFAHQGLAFAQDRERLHQQLDHYLGDPSRVFSDQPLANAKQLIMSAGTPPAGEPRLAAKIHQLELLIDEASTPLVITLNSDGLTNVQIYHVGRLGQFTSRQIELRPGIYTMVGSRPGYRDVRQMLTVKPGSGHQVLDIRCEETI
jgi:tetratricopeptide (TPR) repeat protein